jgi:hypothetical protein
VIIFYPSLLEIASTHSPLDHCHEKLSHKGDYATASHGGTMSDGSATLLTIAGTLAGAAASWYFSRRYYLKSGTDLDAALQPLAGDTQKLLRATNLVARMLEQAGIGQPSYDGDGNLIGIGIKVPVSAVGASAGVGGISVQIIEEPPTQYDRQHEQPSSPEPEADHA